MELLSETVFAINDAGKSLTDVSWVGTRGGRITCFWEHFAEIAKDYHYDESFGAQKICSDLVVVFNDGTWLSRREYDGSEWWAYNRAPVLNSDELLTRDDLRED